MAAVYAAHDSEELDRNFHEARKAAKRARYVLEPLIGAYGNHAARLVEAARQIQAVLGAHQDSVVTQERLRGLRRDAAIAGDSAKTFRRLETRERLLSSQTTDQFHTVWQAASTQRLRRWLQ